MKPEDDKKRNPSQMDPASSPETNCPWRRPVAATPILPSDAPEWAKVMFDSLYKKFGDLERDIGNSIEFVTGLVRNTGDKAEANSVKIQEISEKFSHANCEIGALKQENRFLKKKSLILKRIPDARMCCSMVLTKAVTKPAGTLPLKYTVYLKKSILSSKTSMSLNAIGNANILVAKRDPLLQNFPLMTVT